MQDLKYLFAYLIPFTTFLAIQWQGGWSFMTVIVAFALIPVLEQFLPGNGRNFEPEQETRKEASRFFDWLLYLNVPILACLLWLYFNAITLGSMQGWEAAGLTWSMGVVVGSLGINVAHELGHRTSRFEPLLAKIMLTTALYTHFIIEHNRGHHKWVATPEDPSSARRGENVYRFWVRSAFYSWLKAWKLENERLHRLGQPVFSLQNEMIVFQVCHLAYLAAVWALFGWQGVGFAVLIAAIGFLQSETVNYIEHYGLSRRRLESGHYEPVSPRHSWNSNHELGRIVLYELTRHSDHHYKSTRKYQVLRHFDESPQLPQGYPASMLMALVPPLWFLVMDKRITSLGLG